MVTYCIPEGVAAFFADEAPSFEIVWQQAAMYGLDNHHSPFLMPEGFTFESWRARREVSLLYASARLSWLIADECAIELRENTLVVRT